MCRRGCASTFEERPDEHGDLHTCTAEDGFSASLVLSNGASVAIDSGFAAVANMTPRFTVFGSEAVAELVGEDRISIRRADGTRDSIDLSAATTGPTVTSRRCAASPRSCATRSRRARSPSMRRRSPTAGRATPCSTNCARRRFR